MSASACRTCYLDTLTDYERERIAAEPITSSVAYCPEHQAVMDRLTAGIDWSTIVRRRPVTIPNTFEEHPMSDDTESTDGTESITALFLPPPIQCPIDSAGEVIDHAPATDCTCTFWCGEGSEAGCCWCAHTDIYDPCPAIGFGCGVNDGGCNNGDGDCCTPAQQANAARGA